MQMRRLWWALFLLCAVSGTSERAEAQVGLLLLEGADRPEPDVLALESVELDITIDHLQAHVRMTQIFENRTERSRQGRFELAISEGAAVSSLAIWEREQRREAVVVDRRRGRQVFDGVWRSNRDQARLELVDDGSRQDIYAVRVESIAPFERVRIEVTYSQELELASDDAFFLFPLARRGHQAQRTGRLRARLEVEGGWPLRNVDLRPAQSFRVIDGCGAGHTTCRAELDRQDATLDDELMVGLHHERGTGSDPFRPVILAYRDPSGTNERDAFGGGALFEDDLGYFVLKAPLQIGEPERATARPHDVVVALDTSLSMRGSKLERSVAALERVLRSLGTSDRFGVLTFNDGSREYPASGLAPATAEERDKALSFVRSGYLSGGTDLVRALPAALQQLMGSRAPRRSVFLITDGQPSLGQLESSAIVSATTRANETLGVSQAKVFVLGLGDDADQGLLEAIAQSTQGRYIDLAEGADMALVMQRFLHQVEAPALEDVGVEVGNEIEALYPSSPARVSDGSAYVLYGRYRGSDKTADFRLRGQLGSQRLEQTLTAPLPRLETRRSWIARGWAKRRIAHLLEQIEADGERRSWVGEIVTLAREHLLVTPYTSLVSAARSMLRPREIPPGDPVLTVHADPSDRAVTALFPFGLIKALRPIEPGLFETRFLAPLHLDEGRHDVELVITGHDGQRRLVRDHFVIDSRAPRPQIEPIHGVVRAGDRVTLRVRSDQDTRHLVATLRVPGRLVPRQSQRAELRWDSEELVCLGELLIDPSLPTGSYDVVVVAEDHAHNVGSTSFPLTVRGR